MLLVACMPFVRFSPAQRDTFVLHPVQDTTSIPLKHHTCFVKVQSQRRRRVRRSRSASVAGMTGTCVKGVASRKIAAADTAASLTRPPVDTIPLYLSFNLEGVAYIQGS